MTIIAIAAALAASAPPAEQARQALAAQAAAWNRGALEEALATYCDRPDMLWVSRSGTEAGFADFAAAMRRQFADASTMGTMRIELLHTRAFNESYIIFISRYDIVRILLACFFDHLEQR